jgi:predicted PurR-regulated permease PerM
MVGSIFLILCGGGVTVVVVGVAVFFFLRDREK